MKKRALLFISLFLLFSSVARAEEIDFTASVNKRVLSTQETLVLTLVVSGAQNVSTPAIDPVDGFNLISGPSIGSQTYVVNGAVSTKRIYQYNFSPTRVGTFTIPSYELTANGKSYKTDPISVEVKKGVASTKSSVGETTPQGLSVEEISKKIFVELVTDKDEVVVNEQVILTFRLYRNIAVDGLNYQPSTTKGFLEEPLGKQRNFRKVIEGVEYEVVEIKKALFPVTSGGLTISSAKLKCNILFKAPSKRRRKGDVYDSFFNDAFSDSLFGGRYSRYPIELNSDPILLTVKPLPELGKPVPFSGAIGEYTFSVQAQPSEVAAGDPVTIIMKVTGMGNLQNIKAPAFKGDIDAFKIYEPESKTKILGRANGIYGVKTFEVVLVPKEEAIQEIPAIEFSYFNPRSSTYQVLTKGPFPLKVLPPQKILLPMEPTLIGRKEGVELLEKDIFYIKTSLGTLHEVGRRYFKQPQFYLGLGLPIFLYLGLLLWSRRQERLRVDTAYARSTQAGRQAKQMLKKAQSATNERDVCSLVEKALTNYLSHKTGLPTGTILTNGLSELLVDKGFEDEEVETLKKLFYECDYGQFAGGAGMHENAPQLVKEAQTWIQKAEKRLK